MIEDRVVYTVDMGGSLHIGVGKLTTFEDLVDFNEYRIYTVIYKNGSKDAVIKYKGRSFNGIYGGQASIIRLSFNIKIILL